MSKERDVAEQILQHIGGKENVVSAEHCATRLRQMILALIKSRSKPLMG